MLSHRITIESENAYPTAVATSAILPPPKRSEPLSRSSSISLSPSDRSPSPSLQPHPQVQLQPRLPSHSVHATHSVEGLNAGEVPMRPPQSPRSVRVRSEANAVHREVHKRERVAPHAGNMDVDVDMSFGSASAPYAGPSQVEVGPESGSGAGAGWFGSFSTPERVSPYVPVTQAIPSPLPSSPSFAMPSHQAPRPNLAAPSALPLANPGHTPSSRDDSSAIDKANASTNIDANFAIVSDNAIANASAISNDSPSASANTTANIPASPAPSSVEAPRSRAPSLSHSLPLRFGAALEPELPASGNLTKTNIPGRASASSPTNGPAVGFAFGLADLAASGEARRGRFPAESGPPEPQSLSQTQTQAQAQAQAFSTRGRKVSNADRVGFSWGMGQ